MNNFTKNIILAPMNLLYKFSPEICTKILFRLKTGYELNLKNPVTYNEKLQWLKLYYRNELIPICADKYTVRKYVKDCGCGEMLNELYWHGYQPENIPFYKLPEKFVIKVTNGSGRTIICKNKYDLDIPKVILKLKRWLCTEYLPCYGEWFYGVIKPRVIIEKFLSTDDSNIPVDFKMFYFNNLEGSNGVGVTALDTGRFTDHKKTIYDRDWKFLKNVTFDFPVDKKNKHEKPELYEEMVNYVKKLAFPFPHTRVDFYYINSKIYFGEITFINGAGFDKITPYSFDVKMGNWIKLPVNNKK